MGHTQSTEAAPKNVPARKPRRDKLEQSGKLWKSELERTKNGGLGFIVSQISSLR